MSKLFCDCKTDEEKSNFFLSGQGVETGIIAPAISNEVAMAFHRCFEFEKQLAAVIAACKVKDEALQNCEGMLDELRDYPITHDAIIEALAIQPDDSALTCYQEALEIAKKGLQHYENRNLAHNTRNPAAIALDEIAVKLKGQP